MPHCQIEAVKDHQTFEASSNWKEVKANKDFKKETIQGAKKKGIKEEKAAIER